MIKVTQLQLWLFQSQESKLKLLSFVQQIPVKREVRKTLQVKGQGQFLMITKFDHRYSMHEEYL